MAEYNEITLLLQGASHGDQSAVRELLPLVYKELRAIAGSYFQKQTPAHTLQPTAIVHEAYVKLVNRSAQSWESRAHFMAIVSTAMRQILADHARARNAEKRGGKHERVTMDVISPVADTCTLDVIALNDALDELQRLHERQARVVEMRFFGGLTVKEASHALGVSESTVEEDWRAARSFLSIQLAAGTSS